MTVLSQIPVIFIAFIHLYIIWLEMFVWTTRGRKVFKNNSCRHV
jgi:putative membrane protein